MSPWLGRALLRLAPRSFRDRYQAEMESVLDARMQERRGLARWRLAARESAGLAGMGVLLRLTRQREGGSNGGAREPLAERVARDGRFALRTLRRNPAYSLAALVVLALGIGASTTIFGAANAFFFRPLPFADAGRLFMLYETNPEFGWTDANAAPANVLDWRENVAGFADIAAYSEFLSTVTYQLDQDPVLLGVASVTGNFFEVLGARPALGRSFRWEETWSDADDVLMLSHDTWITMFGGDPSVIGRRIPIGAASAEIVGVMPEGFRFPDERAQLWTTFGWDPAAPQQVSFRRAHWLRPIARLAPDVSPEQAAAQLQAEVTRLQEAFPETNRVMGAGMTPLRPFLVRAVAKPLLVLAGAVGLLLLLTCVNVANLALVRSSARAREVALLQALGAGRSRVASRVATESVTVAAVAGLLGLGLGWAGLRALERLTPLGISGATAAALDYRVVVFAVAVTALTAVLFGLAPTLMAVRGDVGRALRGGERGGGSSAAESRWLRGLVALEVALAVLLVAGAGLMVRTYWHLRHVDPGFRTEGVLAFQFTVPSSRYQARDDVISFYDRFLESLQARPGIERAGLVGQLPLDGASWSSQFQAEGWPPERVGLEILHRRADVGYFEALGIPLLRGRHFQESDGAQSPFVVVINETFEREHFPGEDPIGQRIAYDRAAGPNSTWYEIVGVVGDQGQVSPGVPTRAEVFEHADQDWGRSNWVVLRTSGEPLDAVPTVRAALREMDPLIALGQVRPLREVWQASMAREELVLVLLGAFGSLALLLATVGTYAVTAQAARRRTREIGIRMALGAHRSHVLKMVLRQSLAAVGLGLTAGLLAALLATRALGSLLRGVEPTDPLTLGSVAILLLSVGAFACWVPARRATLVDPVSSLRSE
jgi:putative ABC transport system permease protein